jgi:hypothetical protein
VSVSWTDTILSNTVGVVYRAASGTVDPWTLQAQKDQTAADILQASGPNADPAQVAIAVAQANSSIDANLLSQGAHPDQAGVRIPGLGNLGSAEFLAKAEKIVYGLIVVGVVFGGVYFYSQFYRPIFKKR